MLSSSRRSNNAFIVNSSFLLISVGELNLNMIEAYKIVEYKEIVDNYTKYDYLKPLIKVIKIKHDNSLDPYLEITWIENILENVYVDQDGWYVDSEQKFPTFEGLAMDRSKGFSVNWGNALNKRLEQLDNDDDDEL